MKIIILRIIIILLILSVIGLIVWDYLKNGEFSFNTITRGILILLPCILALIRTSQSRRSPLNFYEKQYADILEYTFREQPGYRKKLLQAIRFYNEDKFSKALRILAEVKQNAKTARDHYATDLFTGLCYTDMGLYDQAIHTYQQSISKGNFNGRIFTNLGFVCMQKGDYENAIIHYNKALEYDPKNAFAYNNIASAYFKMFDLEDAAHFAHKALEINPGMYQASSLLAIIYALSNDKELSEKYFHIAISSGQTPKDLRAAIEHYRNSQYEEE